MREFMCPYCGREIGQHDPCCGEIGHATQVPHIEWFSNWLERTPLWGRIILLMMTGFVLGYMIAWIGGYL